MAKNFKTYKVPQGEFLNTALPEAQGVTNQEGAGNKGGLDANSQKIYDFITEKINNNCSGLLDQQTNEYKTLASLIMRNMVDILEDKIEKGKFTDFLAKQISAIGEEQPPPVVKTVEKEETLEPIENPPTEIEIDGETTEENVDDEPVISESLIENEIRGDELPVEDKTVVVHDKEVLNKTVENVETRTDSGMFSKLKDAIQKTLDSIQKSRVELELKLSDVQNAKDELRAYEDELQDEYDDKQEEEDKLFDEQNSHLTSLHKFYMRYIKGLVESDDETNQQFDELQEGKIKQDESNLKLERDSQKKAEISITSDNDEAKGEVEEEKLRSSGEQVARKKADESNSNDQQNSPSQDQKSKSDKPKRKTSIFKKILKKAVDFVSPAQKTERKTELDNKQSVSKKPKATNIIKKAINQFIGIGTKKKNQDSGKKSNDDLVVLERSKMIIPFIVMEKIAKPEEKKIKKDINSGWFDKFAEDVIKGISSSKTGAASSRKATRNQKQLVRNKKFNGVKGGTSTSNKLSSELNGSDKISSLKDRIKSNIKSKVKSAGRKVWDKTKEFGKQKWETVKQFGKQKWEKAKEFGRKIWSKTKSTGKKFWDKAKKFGKKLLKKPKKVLNKLWKSAKRTGKKIWRKTKKVAKKAWRSVKKAAKKVWKNIKKVAKKVWKVAKKVIKKAVKVGFKVLGKATEIGMRVTGKAMSLTGKLLMKAGTAASSTGLGAIVGVPLMILGGGLTGAGEGISALGPAVGKLISNLGNVFEKLIDSAEKIGEQISRFTKKMSLGFVGTIIPGAKQIAESISKARGMASKGAGIFDGIKKSFKSWLADLEKKQFLNQVKGALKGFKYKPPRETFKIKFKTKVKKAKAYTRLKTIFTSMINKTIGLFHHVASTMFNWSVSKLKNLALNLAEGIGAILGRIIQMSKFGVKSFLKLLFSPLGILSLLTMIGVIFWPKIKTWLHKKFTNFMKDPIGQIKKIISVVGNVLTNVWNFINGTLTTVFGWIEKTTRPGGFISWLTSAIGWVLKVGLTGIKKLFGIGMKGLFKDENGFISMIAGDPIGAILNAMPELLRLAMVGVKKAWGWLIKLVMKPIAPIMKVVWPIYETVGNVILRGFFNTIREIVNWKVIKIPFPWLSKGVNWLYDLVWSAWGKLKGVVRYIFGIPPPDGQDDYPGAAQKKREEQIAGQMRSIKLNADDKNTGIGKLQSMMKQKGLGDAVKQLEGWETAIKKNKQANDDYQEFIGRIREEVKEGGDKFYILKSLVDTPELSEKLMSALFYLNPLTGKVNSIVPIGAIPAVIKGVQAIVGDLNPSQSNVKGILEKVLNYFETLNASRVTLVTKHQKHFQEILDKVEKQDVEGAANMLRDKDALTKMGRDTLISIAKGDNQKSADGKDKSSTYLMDALNDSGYSAKAVKNAAASPNFEVPSTSSKVKPKTKGFSVPPPKKPKMEGESPEEKLKKQAWAEYDKQMAEYTAYKTKHSLTDLDMEKRGMQPPSFPSILSKLQKQSIPSKPMDKTPPDKDASKDSDKGVKTTLSKPVIDKSPFNRKSVTVDIPGLSHKETKEEAERVAKAKKVAADSKAAANKVSNQEELKAKAWKIYDERMAIYTEYKTKHSLTDLDMERQGKSPPSFPAILKELESGGSQKTSEIKPKDAKISPNNAANKTGEAAKKNGIKIAKEKQMVETEAARKKEQELFKNAKDIYAILQGLQIMRDNLKQEVELLKREKGEVGKNKDSVVESVNVETGAKQTVIREGNGASNTVSKSKNISRTAMQQDYDNVGVDGAVSLGADGKPIS